MNYAPPPRFVWCGIVKNESAVLPTLLGSLASWISGVCVTDTGSQDGTVDLIQKWALEHKIPCRISHRPFDDFGKSRNYALDQCRQWEPARDAWVVLLDADMKWQGDLRSVKLHPSNAYQLIQRHSDMEYPNTRLFHVSSIALVRYNGVTHEYLDTAHLTVTKIAPDIAWIQDSNNGANRVDKFERDVRLLRGELPVRTLFYLANTWKDQALSTPHRRDYAESALACYRLRLELDGYRDEKYICYLSMGRLYARVYGDKPRALQSWVDAIQFNPHRPEAYIEVVQYYLNQRQHLIAQMLLDQAVRQVKHDDGSLFSELGSTLRLLDQRAICAFYTGHRTLGYKLTLELLYDYRQESAASYLPFYTERLPRKQVQRLPEGMNPSLIRAPDGTYWLNMRLVNYKIRENGSYDIADPDGVVRTQNCLYSARWNAESQLFDIQTPGQTLHLAHWGNGRVQGYEDLRLFYYGEDGRLDALATTQQHHPEYRNRIVWIQGVDQVEPQVQVLPAHQDCEKNWVPWAIPGVAIPRVAYDSSHWLDLDHPEILVKPDTVELPPPYSDRWRGSTPLVADDQGHYVHLVHEVFTTSTGKRAYYHRLIRRDENYQVIEFSPLLWLHQAGAIEYATGLTRTPEGDWIVTFGVEDQEGYLLICTPAQWDQAFRLT